MICFKDTDNRLLRVNQRLAQSVGKPVEEIEGRHCTEIYRSMRPAFYVDDLKVIRSGVPELGIVETIHGPDGTARWMQTDKVPVCDNDGKVVGESR